MQISGYSSAAMLAYRSSGMKQKAGTVKMQDFSQMVQNTSAQATSQTDKTAATKEVSEVDEMAAFKQEIYEELAEIDKMNSSAILSYSVPPIAKKLWIGFVQMQELLMGFHLVSMLQQQLQELEQLATGQMFTMMIVQQPKPLKRIWLIRRQKVHFIIQIAPMLTVEPHSARGTASMWQVNAKSGNSCRR